MKLVSFTLGAIVIISNVYAQDVIIKNDSSQLKTNIIEINPHDVKYKLFNYADGPMISANRESIAYIIFKNGAVERFAKVEVKTLQVPIYNANRYNMDAVPVTIYKPVDKIQKCEKLYSKKIIWDSTISLS